MRRRAFAIELAHRLHVADTERVGECAVNAGNVCKTGLQLSHYHNMIQDPRARTFTNFAMNVSTSLRCVVAATVLSVMPGLSVAAQATVPPANFQIFQLSPGFASYTVPGTYTTTYGSTAVSTSPFTIISVSSTGDPVSSVISNNAFVNYFFMMQGANGRVAATFLADMSVSLSELPRDDSPQSEPDSPGCNTPH